MSGSPVTSTDVTITRCGSVILIIRGQVRHSIVVKPPARLILHRADGVDNIGQCGFARAVIISVRHTSRMPTLTSRMIHGKPLLVPAVHIVNDVSHKGCQRGHAVPDSST